MNFHDYIAEVTQCGKDFIDENLNWYDNFDDMADEMFVSDMVTGNASGSFTCNTAQAAENVAEAIWDDDVRDSFAMMGVDFSSECFQDPESCDVAIRCAVLPHCLSELEDYYYEVRNNK